MENEEVFQADAELHGLAHMDLRSSYPTKQKGHDIAKAALRGIQVERDISSEESPLLSRNSEDRDREASEREIRGPPKWDGERDFEGLSWWKKPSVRNS